MLRYTILILGFVAVPLITFAQVRITEIMYDLGPNASGSASDSKREWVEIENTGSNAVDLSDWHFNDGSNHTLNAPPKNGGTGSLTLASGAYAILASDADTFLSEHSSFSGTVIDTVMSLNNTAGAVSLIDAGGTTEDSVSYTKDLGGSGDGNSLQLVGSDWVAGIPTPGAANSASPGNSGTTRDTSSTPSSGTDTSAPPPAPAKLDFRADAGSDRSGVTGAPVSFSGMGYGLTGAPLQDARYTWNFGDGSYVEGQKVSHTFMYPGTYRVMLDVASGKYDASDAATVTITDANIEITYVGADRIEVANRSNVELNLSLWRLWSDGEAFTFPKDTVLLPDHVGIFPSAVTGLVVKDPNTVSLRYPNDKVAVEYDKTAEPIAFTQKTYVPKKTPPTQPAPSRKVALASNVSSSVPKKTRPTPTATTALAASSSALLAASASGGAIGFYPWLLGVVSILSIGGLLIFSQKNPLRTPVPVEAEVEQKERSDGEELTADDFTIID